MAPNGSVEWLCLPRPDSPSVFAALLDRAAGNFRFGPTGTQVPHQRRYIPGHHGARDHLAHPDGLARRARPPGGRSRWRTGHVAPTTGGHPATPPPRGTLLRLATCIEGHVEVMANAVPVFEYGLADRNLGLRRRRLQQHDRPPAGRRPDAHGHVAPAPRFCRRPLLRPLHAARRASRPSCRCRGAAIHRTTSKRPRASSTHTVAYWRDWLSNGTFPDHPWRSYMERSALTLKGLSYAPTGAIMAAPTTSLPETPGGARNWDYRYTWIRDSSFMLRSLYRLGFDWEALEYFAFVHRGGGRSERRLRRCRSCTASTGARTSPSGPSTTSPAGGTRGPCGWATEPGTSTRTTCGG